MSCGDGLNYDPAIHVPPAKRIADLERELDAAVGAAEFYEVHEIGQVKAMLDAAVEKRDYYKSGQEILQEEWDNLDADHAKLKRRNAALVAALTVAREYINHPKTVTVFDQREALDIVLAALASTTDTTDTERKA